jgi:hypothetical protein
MKILLKIFKYLFIAILAVVLYTLVSLLFSYQNLRQLASHGVNAKSYIEHSLISASLSDFEGASYYNEMADEEIKVSLATLSDLQDGQLFFRVSPVKKQIQDVEYLFETADLINKSIQEAAQIGERLSRLYSNSQGYSFSNLSNQQKAQFFSIIYESKPQITGLSANLKLASLNLEKINRIGVLYPVYQDISDMKEVIDQASGILEETGPLIKLLPVLAGYPSESNYLILMLNNDELRPGGGFIGVYGLLDIENGEIKHLLTHDSYHLDMPAVGVWHMEPPEAIKKYMEVQNWYLRDANWYPDWPSSALKVQEIYTGESRAIGENPRDFTGIIGITPDFVSDLLDLVGPIEAGGEVYTSENLQPLLQYSVEVAYIEEDISSWDRKEVINELLEKLKNRLMELGIDKLPALIEVMQDNAVSKDIQIYFTNPAWQSIANKMNVTSQVNKNANSDYILVTDANLAAFKTDAVVGKKIKYEVYSGSNPFSRLELSYNHRGGFDWRTTRYRSYTSVYLPLNAKINNIQAQGKLNLEANSIKTYNDLKLNKTVVSFFFSLEPGSEGDVEIEYHLPSSIYQQLLDNSYQLEVQKQAGRRTESFQAIINGDIYNQSLDKDFIIKP